MFAARSKSGRIVRLTKTTWYDKILVGHPEFAEKPEYLEEVKRSVKDPDYIVGGWMGEKLALRRCEIAPRKPKHLCVVYREINDEGRIITAFFTSKYEKLLRRGVLWRRKQS